MRLFPAYLPHVDGRKAKRVYGPLPKAERPKVLLRDGRPAYLYVGSGWVYDGATRCENHVFKLNLPADAGPIAPLRGNKQ